MKRCHRIPLNLFIVNSCVCVCVCVCVCTQPRREGMVAAVTPRKLVPHVFPTPATVPPQTSVTASEAGQSERMPWSSHPTPSRSLLSTGGEFIVNLHTEQPPLSAPSVTTNGIAADWLGLDSPRSPITPIQRFKDTITESPRTRKLKQSPTRSPRWSSSASPIFAKPEAAIASPARKRVVSGLTVAADATLEAALRFLRKHESFGGLTTDLYRLDMPAEIATRPRGNNDIDTMFPPLVRCVPLLC